MAWSPRQEPQHLSATGDDAQPERAGTRPGAVPNGGTATAAAPGAPRAGSEPGLPRPLAAPNGGTATTTTAPAPAGGRAWRAWPPATADPAAGDGQARAFWQDRTRIFLAPLAPPSVIGLFGFMGATLMVGAWQAGWYGSAVTPALIFPFAVMFGGVMQAAAAFPSLRARDALAAAVHATWGAFWLGYGLFWALIAAGVLPAPPTGTADPSFAMWFVVLCAITLMMAIAATFDNYNIAGVLWTLAAGSGLTAAGMWGGYPTVTMIGGILFVISAAIAWYAASAMVFQNVAGRTVLPIFRPRAAAVIPGQHATIPIQYEHGMPGVRVGQ